MVYIILTFVKKFPEHREEAKPNRFAVLICARNEELVLPDLLDCIRSQTYPAERITTFVMADNCTDRTAEVAREKGAVVYTRFNKELVGKGYAMEELLAHIAEDYPENPFDGYFVFVADNLLDEHYVEEMNRTFSDGYSVVTSYRNTKNYADNWISAGYALWFLHEARHLNQGRFLANSCCAISGTGFMFSHKILEKHGGWPFHLLTEDIEFTAECATTGEKIGYCRDAVFYDEQPVTFRQSWKQRMRWVKGYIQVFQKYGKKLAAGAVRGKLACFDMMMNNLPALFFSLIGLLGNAAFLVIAIVEKYSILPILFSLWSLFWGLYGVVFFLGALTLATEWKNIYATPAQKIKHLFMFPVFMMTFLPIAVCAFFERVNWEPIEHKRKRSLKEIRRADD